MGNKSSVNIKWIRCPCGNNITKLDTKYNKSLTCVGCGNKSSALKPLFGCDTCHYIFCKKCYQKSNKSMFIYIINIYLFVCV